MSEFVIEDKKKSPDIPEKKPAITPKKKTKAERDEEIFVQTQNEIYGDYLGPTRKEREIIFKKLIKMFRAACNGKNYYKKWFPELKDTGDFEAAYIEELNKLKK